MILPLALVLLAATASPEPAVESFDMSIDGAAYAIEEFRRSEGPDGIAITGKVSLKLPGAGDAVLRQEAQLGRDARLLSYSLDVDAPGQQVVLSALPAANGFQLALRSKGAPDPVQSQLVAAKSPVFLLDNNFASHLDALTRALTALGPDEERAFTALVPQVMQAIPGTARRGADGTATFSGTALATRSYRLVVANVATELIARASDGALLQAAVPIQHAVLKRRGFVAGGAAGSTAGGTPADTGAPRADPREKSIELAGPATALPATLLVPKSKAAVSAVVFISGSGPNDRDETIGPNKPFADIARGLGDRGVASLRFDKRTLAVKDKNAFQNVRLSDEYYEDAKAAIALLATTAGIDPARIFVVGHSEGAMVAPQVAAANPKLRGIVMMAPGVRPIDAMIIDQMEFGAKLTGLDADAIAEQTATLKAKFAEIRDAEKTNTPPFMGAPAAYWRELIALDVPKMVREAKMPILVLQGDEDIQVRKDADFGLLREQVGDTSGRVTFRSFAGLNHLFMKVEHVSTGAEYGIPGHVEPAVIAAIADWIALR